MFDHAGDDKPSLGVGESDLKSRSSSISASMSFIVSAVDRLHALTRDDARVEFVAGDLLLLLLEELSDKSLVSLENSPGELVSLLVTSFQIPNPPPTANIGPSAPTAAARYSDLLLNVDSSLKSQLHWFPLEHDVCKWI